MNSTELNYIENLCANATNAPWVADLNNNEWIINCGELNNYHPIAKVITKPGYNSENNAKFIAESRQIMLRLLEEVKKLQKITAT